MPTTKNPFPTISTPALEQVADVQGMEVHRTSGPTWTKYLVRDPHVAQAGIDVEIERLDREDVRIECRDQNPRRIHRWIARQWMISPFLPAPGEDLVWNRCFPTRRQAELASLRELKLSARELSYEATIDDLSAQLLGLVAPRTRQRARKEARRRREQSAIDAEELDLDMIELALDEDED